MPPAVAMSDKRARARTHTGAGARQTATGRINLRTSPAAKAVIARAAASLGTTVSAFVVQSAYDAAQKLISQQELLILDPVDFAALTRAIDKPAKANAALKRLMQHA